MSSYIYINNKLVPEEEAKVSIYDRSYLYGEGVFETLRAYNGHVAFCDLHYERLKKNCKRLKIDVPVDKHSFEKAIIKTLNANEVKNAYVRTTLSPEGASYGLKKPSKMKTNFSIFCKQFSGREKKMYEKGARVVIIKSVPSDHPLMADLKSTNYLSKMLARDEVARLKADEGIFCSPTGSVLEGSLTNVFIVKNNGLITPPISEGVLPGVTRSIVLHLAEANGIEATERPFDIEEMKKSDEIFLTGSTTEILPVSEIVDVVKKSPVPGPTTKKIIDQYKALLP